MQKSGPLGTSPSSLLCPFSLETSPISPAFRKRNIGVNWLLLWALYILLSYASVLAAAHLTSKSCLGDFPDSDVKNSIREKLFESLLNPHSFVDMLLFKPGPSLTGQLGIVAIFIIPQCFQLMSCQAEEWARQPLCPISPPF